MKSSKTIVIIGIISYILGVITSAQDLKGNFTSPIFLIVISGIMTYAFIIIATIRLWRASRYVSILLIFSEVMLIIFTVIQEIVSAKYGSPVIISLNIIKVVSTLTFFYAICLLWVMAKHESKIIDTLSNKYGLTSGETSTILEEKRKGNEKSVEKIFANLQERTRTKYKKTTGIDPKNIIFEIGKDISWVDIVHHVFRIIEFDRNGTIIGPNNKVKALSQDQPYGFLLVESPILNNKAKIPIIHRDDFLLAASLFNNPKLSKLVNFQEFLVTYEPEILLPDGLSGSPSHVLHYIIVPSGTLDLYYSTDNDLHMAKPDPEKLFGPFKYKGMIEVQISSEFNKTKIN